MDEERLSLRCWAATGAGTEAKLEARAEVEFFSVVEPELGRVGLGLGLEFGLEPRLRTVLLAKAGANHLTWARAKSGVRAEISSRVWAWVDARHELDVKNRTEAGAKVKAKAWAWAWGWGWGWGWYEG